ncbi:MAG: FCD domain-containing protein [Hyphomicrobiaceae bacterium]|nr:MAG: FCD domain-containing protein [Hyphomicrobiaceae bacterium]
MLAKLTRSPARDILVPFVPCDASWLGAETRGRIAPFSRVQFRTVGRLDKSHAEHELVLDAIVQGSPKAASAAMRKHIESVYNAYADYQSDV